MKKIAALVLLFLCVLQGSASADLGQNYVVRRHLPGKGWTCTYYNGSYAWYCTKPHDKRHRVVIVNDPHPPAGG